MLRTISCLLAFSLVVACGGSSKKDVTTPDKDTPPPVVAEDQTFQLGEQAVAGVTFTPEAIVDPILVVLPSKEAVKKQEKAYQAAKGEKRAELGVRLAATLWLQEGSAEQIKANNAKVLTILREVAVPDTATEKTLAMRAAAEEQFGERAQAAEAYDKLISRFPESKDVAKWRVRRAWLALLQNDMATAQSMMVNNMDTAAEGTTADAAYVVAWLNFKMGDQERAAEALGHAARRWERKEALPGVQRDVLLFDARAGRPVEDSLKDLKVASGDSNDVYVRLVGGLPNAYVQGGRYGLADAVAGMLAEKATQGALVEILFLRVNLAYKQNYPDKVAEYLTSAWENAKGAGDKVNAQLVAAIPQSAVSLAFRYDAVYRTSGDPRYADAAEKLYALYLGIEGQPEADVTKATTERANLKDYVEKKAAQGVHNEQLIKDAVLARTDEVTACYERFLQGEPTLTGPLQVTVTIEDKGTVSGVVTNPAADGAQRGLPGVSDCIARAVQQWAFPGRTKAGKTTATITYQLAPKS